MHFKRLELFGFKSFAERTKLEFEPGVTAIVGPNGCGKSNIADSIKWVLGEQSVKAIRGTRMEDVIFNGTDIKEAVNYAEVSLTLSNESKFLPIEYDEVTITRRLYRSGESEYLLNKATVRLRDITELFMGTGIGQSAYSLIEQGKIDQLLSSKPEERREVFEEASGITKYKTKKKEALRRLEDTENNLVRVNDIIAEVKRQINSIERQANKAKKYKEEFERLKDLEIKLGYIESESLNIELNSVDCEINNLKQNQEHNTIKIKDLVKELEYLKISHNEQDLKRANLRATLTEIETGIFTAHSRLTLNKERLEELSERKEVLQEELIQVKERIVEQEPALKLAQENFSTIEEDDRTISSMISQREQALSEITGGIKASEETISKTKLLLIDIAARQAKYRSQSAKVSATLTSSRARSERLNIEKLNVSREKMETESKLNESEKRLLELTSQLDGIKQDYEKKLKVNNELKAVIEDLEKKIGELQVQQSHNHSKLELLKEAKLRYEGFSTGVQTLLGQNSTERANFGLHDVVANLIEISPGYEGCIEAALGDFVETIVVDSLDLASEAIKFLKENNAGKAQFIDLNRLDWTNIETEILAHPCILGRAIDFVKTDSRYQALVNFLLKGIYIIKDPNGIKPLIEMGPANFNRCFITLSGELIRGGIIKGGSSSKCEWEILNRDTKIKELTNILEEMSFKIDEFLKDKKRIEEQLPNLIEQIDLLTALLNEKEALLTNTKAEYLKYKESFKGITEECSLVNSELDELSSEIETLKNEEEDTLKRIEQTVQENSLTEQSIKDNEEIILKGTKKREALLIEIAELKTKIGTIKEQKKSLIHTIQILETSYNDSLNLLKSRSLEIETIDSKIKELKNENQDRGTKEQALAEEKDKYLIELSKIEALLSEISSSISLKNKSLSELEALQNNITKELYSKELKKNEVGFNIESLSQRLSNIYKIELSQLQFLPDISNLGREKLKEEISIQKARIDSMGQVNLVAIEEQKELEERFNFLTNQREDLFKAKDSLLKAISKINRTTRKLFIETFEKIRIEFKDYFRLLFGGGQGDLLLMDESDVLECGIEIVAQPPGKRLQNISLLSGGERSLCAIALLFAIFKAKPSPFCVLDEIDAALDETNVDRFTRVLEEFVKSSQFIIITHNKKTINMADVMYGITMEELGISKIVSVRFAENNQ